MKKDLGSITACAHAMVKGPAHVDRADPVEVLRVQRKIWENLETRKPKQGYMAYTSQGIEAYHHASYEEGAQEIPS